VTQRASEHNRLSGRGAAFVLAVAYLGLSALYAWQAAGRLSPTIFVDEIQLAQISRSIAETGAPGRRGEPYGFESLYAYVLAPTWWIDDSKAAWEAVKLVGVLAMTAALFPAYALARFVASRPWAVAAGIASVAAPPLAYAPYLMQEPLAYPVATLGLWLVARYVAHPTRWTFAVAAVTAAVGWVVRGELALIALVLLVGVLFHVWRSRPLRRWRTEWTRGDWVGLSVLAVGGAVVLSAAAGHRSEVWYVATGFLKQRVVEHATWALGAVAIGIGVLPLVCALAVLASPHLRRNARDRAFVVTGATALVAFTAYAGVKGAYLSTVLGPLVLERNVIYTVPVLFAATAAALSRAAYARRALAVAGLLTLGLIANAELHLDKYPYFEAPGLAVGALANRNWAMDADAVRGVLYGVLLAVVVLLAARKLVRPRVAANVMGATVLVVVGSWSLTSEVYAARGLNEFSKRLDEATIKPVDWVDRATGGEDALYLGRLERDPNEVWLLEFWNRSIRHVWSVDGSAPPPTLTPDLGTTDGTLAPDPGVRWVVAREGVDVAGEPVSGPHRGLTLYRLDGPLRLRNASTGVEPDGWMGNRAAFSYYTADDGADRGFARIVLSRQGACGDVFPTSTAHVRVGPLAIGSDKQPAIGRVEAQQRVILRPCAIQTVVLRARVPFHVVVTVEPTFVPRELDPSSPDPRELGAQVGFGFIPIG